MVTLIILMTVIIVIIIMIIMRELWQTIAKEVNQRIVTNFERGPAAAAAIAAEATADAGSGFVIIAVTWH